ncbi:permease prefix domain 1-containing protein [Paenibacillus sp. FA6]|uniref:permease prefix domain 1-containing protein n=1 Tax=Paenibacillus sp. FA6 TaxID=3413029 RepID=UPI003F656508
MNRLQQHVEHLFSGYKQNKQTKELKYEIVSNLEAKVSDLTESGMAMDQAISIAIDHMDSIDGLIDGNPQVYIHRFQMELVQISLMYTLLAWILTIPLGILGTTRPLSLFLFMIVIILGVVFLLLNRNKRDLWLNKISTFPVESFLRYRRMVWNIWGIFMVVSITTTTALRFGSNIWFMRPIHIDGPYQFAVTAIPFLLPMISIIIPLLFNSVLGILHKYEVGVSYED